MRHAWLVMVAVLMGASQASAASGKAVIQATKPNSAVSGEATLTETSDGLRVSVQVRNVSPGKHGLHIHDRGSCEEAGNAAGGHYNPDNAPHGFLPKDGLLNAHPGDLGNIDVGQDGTGRLELTLKNVRLQEGKYTVANRAIVLHEKADDFGQPTGNAGGRIGCGVIAVANK